MVTTTTSLLHDIEEYFTDTVAWRKNFPRLHPSALLKRAHEQLTELDADLHDAERRAARTPRKTCCNCWRMLDDNNDS